ncbi:uncharacterized protein LOC115616233 [Strigops habroptila]|uniref:uncharacterized protein LOC115616233 n=1 Tax=Strigops habroptila TaxID=2489341 RepID=UPI0011CF74AC|nr:uncharacterized protein LOC115616233 [Strigops habroptila]
MVPFDCLCSGQAVVWVSWQEAHCPHGRALRLWLAVPWRDATSQAKADNEGLRWRLWDLEKAPEQAQKDKRDIPEEMTLELQEQTAAPSQCLKAKVKSLQEQLDVPALCQCPWGYAAHCPCPPVHWKEVGMTIAMEHKEHLREFGLNPLGIQHSGAPGMGQALSPYVPISTLGELSTSSVPQSSSPGLGRSRHSPLHNTIHMNSSVGLSFNHTPDE